MAGEGHSPPPGSSKVESQELIEVEVVDDEGPFDGDGPIAAPVEGELEQAPTTVGDIVDGARDAVSTVGTSARRLFDRGRYRKVRVTRKGKQVLPDIPIAAVAAAEVASVYGAGLARVLAVNIGTRFLFDVEIVNEADRYFKVGVERFLEGDLERSEEALLKAVRIDDTHAESYLQLGVLYRMRGEFEQALQVLERARRLDDAGDVGKKAGDIIRAINKS